jgi:pimeloyl-ACP methyl ester carboxylesterase
MPWPTRYRSLRIWLVRSSLVVLLLVGLWLLSSLGVAYRLTGRAKPPFTEPAPSLPDCPVESHRLLTADREQLGAWFLPGSDAGPSVLILHGNGGCRINGLPVARLFRDEGCSVLLVTLRAHGDSTGDRNDIGYSARHDVLRAVEFLEERRPGRPILIHGTSLGAAAAIFAAPLLGNRVQGYILESPYRDLRTAVRNRTSAYLPPLLSEVAYAGLLCVSGLILPELDEISPVKHIGTIPETVPVLILAGSRDDRARPEEVRELFDQVSSHARLVFVEGAGHHGMLEQDPLLYRAELGRLLRQVQWPSR